MELKLIGKVKLILDLQSWDSGFTKREFVITTNEQYPQDVKLECIKDKTSLLDGLSEGDDVEVSFNVNGLLYIFIGTSLSSAHSGTSITCTSWLSK